MSVGEYIPSCKLLVLYGGQGRNRTADASLFRAALYRLSYLAFSGGKTQVYQTIYAVLFE